MKNTDFNSKDGNNLKNIINSHKTRQNVNSAPQNEEENNEQNSETKNTNLGKEAIKKEATEAVHTATGVPRGIVKPVVSSILDKVGDEAIDETIDQAKKQVKKKVRQVLLKVLASAAPYIIGIFIIIFTVTIIMTEFYEIADKVDKALVAASQYEEKFLNWSTGNGWKTEKEDFFETLRSNYVSSRDYTSDGKGLNVPLVAATIHYNYMIELDLYQEDQDVGKSESLHINESLGSEESLFDDFIRTRDTKNFYETANDKLGKIESAANVLNIGERRLLGHLVSPEFSWDLFNFSDAVKQWELFFNYFDQTTTADDIDSLIRFMINPAWEIGSMLQEKLNLARNYENSPYKKNGSAGWIEYTYQNGIYELQEWIEYFDEKGEDGYLVMDSETAGELSSTIENNKNLVSDLFGFLKERFANDRYFPAPKITYVYTEEVYKDYLRNIYIPLTYGVGEPRNYGNDPKNDYKLDTIIDEIYNQADTFDYLFNIDETIGEDCHFEYKSDDASDVDSLKVNGIPVNKNLIDNMKVIVDGDIISVEDYIIGVSYAESSGAQEEARKANMIAQQSFLFSRASISEENGTYYFTIENSSNAQNYCNVYSGCDKRALKEEEIQAYKESYQSIKYQFLYESTSGQIIAYYRSNYSQCPSYAIGKCMGQTDSYDDEKNGNNYRSILANYYTQLSLIDIENGKVSNRVYVCYSSGLVGGSHGSFPQRVSAPSGYPYSNLGSYGECVWYAKGRAIEIMETVSGIDEETRNYILKKLWAQGTGNGNQYCDYLMALTGPDGSPLFGTSTDYKQPKAGALACYNNYVAMYNGWYGHVVVIEDVQGDQVTITQGGKGFAGYFNRRTYSIAEMATIPGSTTSTASFIRYVYLLD